MNYQRHQESTGGPVLSGLGNLVASLKASLTRGVEVAAWWQTGTEAGASVSDRMNTDYGGASTRDLLTAVGGAWPALPLPPKVIQKVPKTSTMSLFLLVFALACVFGFEQEKAGLTARADLCYPVSGC